MKKHLHILNVKSKTFMDALLSFRFDDLRYCPEDNFSSIMDYRSKKTYTKEERRILKLIPNVSKVKSLYAPAVCSGLRGDGSRFRNKCKHFIGYDKNNEQVFNFHNPQKFINCKKFTKVKIEKYASDCKKRKLIVSIARKKGLIYEFGSAVLEEVSKRICLKCKDFDNENQICKFKFGCSKSEFYFVLPECNYGDCETCPEKKLGGEK